MRVNYIPKDPEKGPDRLVGEAEIVFEEGMLAGLKLVGFSLWLNSNTDGGEVFVTFPARAFGAGAERKFFDFLRVDHPQGDTIRFDGAGLVRNVKAEIIKACVAQGMVARQPE